MQETPADSNSAPEKQPEKEPQKPAAADEKKPEGGRDLDVEKNKVWAAVSYIWLACVILMLVKKDSRFVQFHARQALMLALMMTVLMIVLAAFSPFWYFGAIWTILQVCNVVFVVVELVGLIQAAQGKYWKIPYLGNWAFKIFGEPH